ncbi:bestrophin-like domain [Luteolibacter soli]|uniref:DUF4239 domain-containing protein n=1 Tax=Luteolibacter soli TaxID=3135280 RepID=A0ABU9AXC3_9BACT
MSHAGILDVVPVWVFFIFVALIAIVPIEVGQRLGARRRRKEDHESEGPVSSVVGATLGLLGFMVALTVGSTTARFDARKEAIIDGVNAIETAYRNSALLPEPHRSECRQLLRDYTAVRIQMPALFGDPDHLRALDAQVRKLQRSLWSHAEELARVDRSSEIYALFTASLNEVDQLYNKRIIMGSQHRIPFLVWVVLFIVTIITMLGVGFHFGLAGSRSLTANLMLALTFALVISLIFDLDQPGKGWVNVSQQPMDELNERLHAAE